ncbi:MAG: hypothetical protein K9N06_09655 [Candidatus Cloacimonetes bacterium]|nr:hypothetical protein [Candidatus Cloacimonadota bacterium]
MKENVNILIFILFILAAASLFAAEISPEYEFIQDDSSYSFRSRIAVKATPECLLNLIYDFTRIPEYSVGVKSLEMVNEGENWYDVSFIYQNLLLLKNYSLWRRTMQREKNRIFFEMLDNSNNLSFIPELLASHGYYQILPEEDGCIVEIYQQCILQSCLIDGVYIHKAEEEAKKFMEVFREFLIRNCEN